MRDKSRIYVAAAVITAFLILFVPFFIAHNADHECTGGDCPICTVTASFEHIMGGRPSADIQAAAPAAVFVCVCVHTAVMSVLTPVILKDRLLN